MIPFNFHIHWLNNANDPFGQFPEFVFIGDQSMLDFSAEKSITSLSILRVDWISSIKLLSNWHHPFPHMIYIHSIENFFTFFRFLHRMEVHFELVQINVFFFNSVLGEQVDIDSFLPFVVILCHQINWIEMKNRQREREKRRLKMSSMHTCTTKVKPDAFRYCK